MAFKQEHPGVWYDREATGDAPFKVVWNGFVPQAKMVTADGVFHNIDPILATVLVTNIRETCAVVKIDGEVCGRELPCRYHG
jgi:hypothetical protein